MKESLATLAYASRVASLSDPSSAAKKELGQFPTPMPVAALMASMFSTRDSIVRLLDAGAGTGTLIRAFVERRCSEMPLPQSIHVEAYEIDSRLIPMLDETIDRCRVLCSEQGVKFTALVHNLDFIEVASGLTRDDLFAKEKSRFTATILNPPYRKINSSSQIRAQLRSSGIETSNLYTAFLALAAKLLSAGGEMVAITPRSFANGPYFRPFREMFLGIMSLRRIHLFESRSTAFARDKVLQENIILNAIKSPAKPETVLVSMSSGAPNAAVSMRECSYREIVSPDDTEMFIHLWTDDKQAEARRMMSKLHANLTELGLEVSTGRVVDFRVNKFLRMEPGPHTVPLIYSCHFQAGYVTWPRVPSRKPNALLDTQETHALMLPAGVYVLTKRFSAKEERRRVVACIYDPARVPAPNVGFENHLNYFHVAGSGIPKNLALGLAAYLNSTVLDNYFRQFNGHTQVNATDLRNLPYPERSKLEAVGRHLGPAVLNQQELDQLLQKELFDD